MFSHEQMKKQSPFSVLNIEQTSNWLGVKQALLYMYIYISMMCKIIFIYTQFVHVYDVHLLRDYFFPERAAFNPQKSISEQIFLEVSSGAPHLQTSSV